MTRFSDYFTDNHQNLINLNLNRVRPGLINTEVSGGFGNHDVVLQSHVIESLKDIIKVRTLLFNFTPLLAAMI